MVSYLCGLLCSCTSETILLQHPCKCSAIKCLCSRLNSPFFWYSRNNTVAQEIISQIQKLLSTRSQQKAKSAGNGQEYLHVGEEHLRRRDFKKAVICLSLVITHNVIVKWKSFCWNNYGLFWSSLSSVRAVNLSGLWHGAFVCCCSSFVLKFMFWYVHSFLICQIF